MSQLSKWAETIKLQQCWYCFVLRVWIAVRLLVGCSSFSYNAVRITDCWCWVTSFGSYTRQRRLSFVNQIAEAWHEQEEVASLSFQKKKTLPRQLMAPLDRLCVYVLLLYWRTVGTWYQLPGLNYEQPLQESCLLVTNLQINVGLNSEMPTSTSKIAHRHVWNSEKGKTN